MIVKNSQIVLTAAETRSFQLGKKTRQLARKMSANYGGLDIVSATGDILQAARSAGEIMDGLIAFAGGCSNARG